MTISDQKARLTKSKNYLLFFSVSAILLLLYYFGFSTVELTSENATPSIFARTVESGMPLHGWIYPPDNFVFLDSIVDYITNLFVGFGPLAVRLSSVLIYFTMIITTIIISREISNNKNYNYSYKNVIIIMAFIGVPVFFDKPLLSAIQYTPDHILTISATSVIFSLASRIANRSFYLSKPIDLSLFFLLSTTTYISDELSLFICMAPLLIASILMFKSRKTAMLLIITAISATLSYIIINKNILFYTIKLPASFADFEHFRKNLIDLFYYFSLSLGANFWGLKLDGLSLLLASRLSLFGFVVYYLYAATRKFLLGIFCTDRTTYDFSENFLATLCLLAILINLTSTVFSNAFYIYGSYVSSNIRYIFPAIVFSVAIISGFCKNRIVFLVAVVILSMTIYADFYFLSNSKPKNISPEITDIINIIKKNGYHGGFSPYWYGNIITLASHAEIIDEPIAPTGARGAKTIYWPGRKVYAVWNSDSLLSKKINKNHFFVIVNTNSAGDIKISQAEKYFGIPQKIEDIHGYSAKVMFYDE